MHSCLTERRNIRRIFYIVNHIFVICGIFLIAFGSVLLKRAENIHLRSTEFGYKLNSILVAIIVAGCLIISISLFGCCGARYNNAITINIYSILMHVIFILLWLLLQYLVYERDTFEEMAEEFVNEAWTKRDDSMDLMQMEFNCCGVDGYEDYKESNHSIPLTCCGLNIFKCASNEYTAAPGCRDAFAGYWATNTEIMIFSGLGIAYVQFVCLIAGLLMMKQLRRCSSTS